MVYWCKQSLNLSLINHCCLYNLKFQDGLDFWVSFLCYTIIQVTNTAKVIWVQLNVVLVWCRMVKEWWLGGWGGGGPLHQPKTVYRKLPFKQCNFCFGFGQNLREHILRQSFVQTHTLFPPIRKSATCFDHHMVCGSWRSGLSWRFIRSHFH